jgi:competence protein ComEC
MLISDSLLPKNISTVNFHLLPSRTFHRTRDINTSQEINNVVFTGIRLVIFNTKRYQVTDDHQVIDIAVFSDNTNTTISEIIKTFRIRKIVIAGSVKGWRSALWKNECDSLKIPYHVVSEKGAFVMNF